MKLFWAALLLALMGCAVERKGVVYHVVVGFGVVRVGPTNSAATVVRTRALGIHAAGAPGSFAAGYVDQTSVNVKTNSNVLLELR